jgi:hypothetical protein
MPTLDTMTVNLKINPEMSDEAKLILREMIVAELKVVFPDTIKPLETLLEQIRGEIHELVKEDIEEYMHRQMDSIRTQVGRKHLE